MRKMFDSHDSSKTTDGTGATATVASSLGLGDTQRRLLVELDRLASTDEEDRGSIVLLETRLAAIETQLNVAWSIVNRQASQTDYSDVAKKLAQIECLLSHLRALVVERRSTWRSKTNGQRRAKPGQPSGQLPSCSLSFDGRAFLTHSIEQEQRQQSRRHTTNVADCRSSIASPLPAAISSPSGRIISASKFNPLPSAATLQAQAEFGEPNEHHHQRHAAPSRLPYQHAGQETGLAWHNNVGLAENNSSVSTITNQSPRCARGPPNFETGKLLPPLPSQSPSLGVYVNGQKFSASSKGPTRNLSTAFQVDLVDTPPTASNSALEGTKSVVVDFRKPTERREASSNSDIIGLDQQLASNRILQAQNWASQCRAEQDLSLGMRRTVAGNPRSQNSCFGTRQTFKPSHADEARLANDTREQLLGAQKNPPGQDWTEQRSGRSSSISPPARCSSFIESAGTIMPYPSGTVDYRTGENGTQERALLNYLPASFSPIRPTKPRCQLPVEHDGGIDAGQSAIPSTVSIPPATANQPGASSMAQQIYPTPADGLRYADRLHHDEDDLRGNFYHAKRPRRFSDHCERAYPPEASREAHLDFASFRPTCWAREPNEQWFDFGSRFNPQAFRSVLASLNVQNEQYAMNRRQSSASSIQSNFMKRELSKRDLLEAASIISRPQRYTADTTRAPNSTSSRLKIINQSGVNGDCSHHPAKNSSHSQFHYDSELRMVVDSHGQHQHHDEPRQLECGQRRRSATSNVPPALPVQTINARLLDITATTTSNYSADQLYQAANLLASDRAADKEPLFIPDRYRSPAAGRTDFRPSCELFEVLSALSTFSSQLKEQKLLCGECTQPVRYWPHPLESSDRPKMSFDSANFAGEARKENSKASLGEESCKLDQDRLFGEGVHLKQSVLNISQRENEEALKRVCQTNAQLEGQRQQIKRERDIINQLFDAHASEHNNSDDTDPLSMQTNAETYKLNKEGASLPPRATIAMTKPTKCGVSANKPTNRSLRRSKPVEVREYHPDDLNLLGEPQEGKEKVPLRATVIRQISASCESLLGEASLERQISQSDQDRMLNVLLERAISQPQEIPDELDTPISPTTTSESGRNAITDSSNGNQRGVVTINSVSSNNSDREADYAEVGEEEEQHQQADSFRPQIRRSMSHSLSCEDLQHLADSFSITSANESHSVTTNEGELDVAYGTLANRQDEWKRHLAGSQDPPVCRQVFAVGVPDNKRRRRRRRRQQQQQRGDYQDNENLNNINDITINNGTNCVARCNADLSIGALTDASRYGSLNELVPPAEWSPTSYGDPIETITTDYDRRCCDQGNYNNFNLSKPSAGSAVGEPLDYREEAREPQADKVRGNHRSHGDQSPLLCSSPVLPETQAEALIESAELETGGSELCSTNHHTADSAATTREASLEIRQCQQLSPPLIGSIVQSSQDKQKNDFNASSTKSITESLNRACEQDKQQGRPEDFRYKHIADRGEPSIVSTDGCADGIHPAVGEDLVEKIIDAADELHKFLCKSTQTSFESRLCCHSLNHCHSAPDKKMCNIMQIDFQQDLRHMDPDLSATDERLASSLPLDGSCQSDNLVGRTHQIMVRKLSSPDVSTQQQFMEEAATVQRTNSQGHPPGQRECISAADGQFLEERSLGSRFPGQSGAYGSNDAVPRKLTQKDSGLIEQHQNSELTGNNRSAYQSPTLFGSFTQSLLTIFQPGPTSPSPTARQSGGEPPPLQQCETRSPQVHMRLIEAGDTKTARGCPDGRPQVQRQEQPLTLIGSSWFSRPQTENSARQVSLDMGNRETSKHYERSMSSSANSLTRFFTNLSSPFSFGASFTTSPTTAKSPSSPVPASQQLSDTGKVFSQRHFADLERVDEQPADIAPHDYSVSTRRVRSKRSSSNESSGCSLKDHVGGEQTIPVNQILFENGFAVRAHDENSLRMQQRRESFRQSKKFAELADGSLPPQDDSESRGAEVRDDNEANAAAGRSNLSLSRTDTCAQVNDRSIYQPSGEEVNSDQNEQSKKFLNKFCTIMMEQRANLQNLDSQEQRTHSRRRHHLPASASFTDAKQRRRQTKIESNEPEEAEYYEGLDDGGDDDEDEEARETRGKIEQMFQKQQSVTSEGSASSKQSVQKSRTKWLVAAVSIRTISFESRIQSTSRCVC